MRSLRPTDLRPSTRLGRRGETLLAGLAGLLSLSLLSACVGDQSVADGPQDPVSSSTTASTTADSNRPPDLAGVATPLPDGDLTEVPVRIEPVSDLAAPTALAPRPGTDELYVAQRTGEIRLLSDRPDGAVSADTPIVLDLHAQTTTDGNRGLLGLAFSADGRTMFVSHTNTDGNVTVARYDMDGRSAVPKSRRELLNISMRFDDHNGGTLRIGPDGKLWFALGDGGGIDDPDQRAQDPADLRGKLLQLDPAGVDEPAIYASGLRNPFRYSFDSVTGDLWLTDVGQEGAEEIDFVPNGTPATINFGWSGYEGSKVLFPDRVEPDTHAPIMEMSHQEHWCAGIGGVVYRGAEIASLVGSYIFGDVCKQDMYVIDQHDGEVARQRILDVDVNTLIAIEQDARGEIWVLTLTDGLFRLRPAGTG